MEKLEEKIIFLLLSIALLWILKDYIITIMNSLILSYILLPIQKRLEKYFGRKFSAFLIVSFIILSLILSILYAFSKILKFVVSLTAVEITFPKGFEKYYPMIRELERVVFSKIYEFLYSLVKIVPKFFVDLSIMLVLVYYILSEREKIVSFLEEVLPHKRFFEVTKKTLDAIFYGHFLTAFCQFLICILVFHFFKAPYSLLASFAVFLLALVGITPALVYIPLGIFKMYIGDTFGGSMIIFLGISVVSTIDNIIKPKLASKFYDIHPAIFLITAIGGLSVFGFVGMFIGPCVYAILRSMVEIYVEAKGKKS